jgi:hypothetical protein
MKPTQRQQTNQPISINDLTGQRFGMLVVIARYLDDFKQREGSYWKCRCDCGKTRIVRGSSLRNGQIQTCEDMECRRLLTPFHGGRKDLTGQRFGRLTALEATSERQHRNVMWRTSIMLVVI